jgi:hypothetical protein
LVAELPNWGQSSLLTQTLPARRSKDTESNDTIVVRHQWTGTQIFVATLDSPFWTALSKKDSELVRRALVWFNSAFLSRYLSGLLATHVGVRAAPNSESFRERALSGLVINY